MIKLGESGSFANTEAWLAKLKGPNLFADLSSYGERGVAALRAATPVDSSETANSWSYKIESTRTGGSIVWYNSHINQGANIAVLLQYGHGTGTGGYIAGRDYINPAMKPIFDQIASELWKKVNNG